MIMSKGKTKGLPVLVAPERFVGGFTKWTPKALREEREKWAAEQGRKGYSSTEVGEAIGITQANAHRIMVLGGWDVWEHLRKKER